MIKILDIMLRILLLTNKRNFINLICLMKIHINHMHARTDSEIRPLNFSVAPSFYLSSTYKETIYIERMQMKQRKFRQKGNK